MQVGTYGRFIGCTMFPKCRYIAKKSKVDEAYQTWRKQPRSTTPTPTPDTQQRVSLLFAGI